MRLLITRPQPDADAQAAVLKDLGHDPVLAPMLTVEVHDPGPLPVSDVQALIVTSRNTLRALEQLGQTDATLRLPLFAVGEATARLAKEMGFGAVTAGPGTADVLVPVIRDQCDPAKGPLLYLTGERTAFDLQAPLQADGFSVKRQVLYATRPVGMLDPETATELRSGRLDGVVLMSPATAKAYVENVKASELAGAAERLVHLCLSANVAEALADLAGARCSVAAKPTQDDLLALITREAANC